MGVKEVLCFGLSLILFLKRGDVTVCLCAHGNQEKTNVIQKRGLDSKNSVLCQRRKQM